ncbi:MAG: hypothetical protein E6Q60_05645 [Nitrosomonas oligotropha]|uniref:Uncharacterized protein n=1 Tax=Nitrosomonas oligotropha TaxID=42354 RepID=A0A5C7VTS8_9PROT|nr:MAG: hypothetical protein E6Q60_05645 [Nitrosomonas oligotropha]
MHKKIIFSILFLWSTVVSAIDVDFSKSFVIPETSGINNLTIGGIEAIGNSYKVDFNLREDLSLAITNAEKLTSVSEQLEQKLRNTIWKGTYVISDLALATTLQLVVVQDGYVGGEITHTTTNGYLKTRVTGDIITQYKVVNDFIDEDRIDPKILSNLPINTETRQLIRIKRMRALEFKNDSAAGWSANREYRLILEDSVLSGVVGIPNDIYGVDDATTGNGSISLVKQ